MRRGGLAVALLAGLLALPPAAPAQAPIGGHRQNDGGGFRNILPPGQNGAANSTQVASFLAGLGTPPHALDQLDMYGDLVYAAPGIAAADLDRFYKDASFGVAADRVGRTYSPREDVTIVRDEDYGVPHIYGRSRAGAMFGAGYTAAEDKLFLMDVLRHYGRSELTTLIGGSPANFAMDRDQFALAPYTEADLQRQIDQFDDLYGPDGRVLQEDLRHYVEGINSYLDTIRANPTRLPGIYAAIGLSTGPEEWRTTDVVATAALVGGILGGGGGGELANVEVIQAARERFGTRAGRRVYQDFRSAEDPEAPVTVEGRRFPYQRPPRRRARGSIAIPDPGSLRRHDVEAAGTASGSAASTSRFRGHRMTPQQAELGARIGRDLRQAMKQGGGSNALVVSARESASGRPLAVFGPQTAYYIPQLLTEMDIHAPAVGGPAIDARGAAFIGTNVVVQLGRGRDYAWSGTSAGQDIIDTFALPLCEPGGGRPTLDSQHYEYRGECRAIEQLEKVNSYTPTAAGPDGPGTERYRIGRTALGLELARATIGGRPVIYTSLRSTYLHEVDSAIGFLEFNSPDRINGPADFQRAASKIGYTFHWFYVDPQDTAYFNSGNMPVRARGADSDFPVFGRFEWKGWDPVAYTAPYARFAQHPQAINQAFFANWNNKAAREFRASEANYAYGPAYRSQTLSDRIRAGIRGSASMSLVELVSAMEDAGTVDVEGAYAMQWVLRALGSQQGELGEAAAKLRDWVSRGAHRLDRNRDGAYDDAEAIRIKDAWYPLLVEAIFEPALGRDLFREIESVRQVQDHDIELGRGSAFNGGWYGFVQKDLRNVLGRRVRGRWSRRYCGGGNLARCRAALADSLRAALRVPEERLYPRTCTGFSRQMCRDTVRHSAVGVIEAPELHWINRPTFQQVVEVERRAPR